MRSTSPTDAWPEPVPPSDDGAAATPAERPGSAVDGADPTGTVLLQQSVRVATGLAALGIAAIADAVRHTMPTPPPSDEPAPDRADRLGLLTGAALGVTLLVGDRVANVVGEVSRTIGPPASWIAGVPPLGPAAGWLRDVATSLDDRWRTARPDAEEVATSFARELVPQVVDVVLDQLDLTWLVAERVDVDQLIAHVDLNAAVERVDIDRIIARVDLDEVASRIDVEAVVSRVNLDAIAQRIDIDAVVDRVDLVGLARYVVDEIDLPEIIRESSGAMASETVRGMRMQGIEADAAVSRAVDRVLLRRRARDTDEPGEPIALDAADEAPPEREDPERRP